MHSIKRHGRMLGTTVLAALALGSIAAPAASAKSWLTMDETEGRVRGWTVGYSSGFAGCMATSGYTDQSTMWFGHSLKQSYFIAITNPAWHVLKPGTTYQLELRVPNFGKWNGKFIAFEYNGTKGVFIGNLKEAFIEQFSAAMKLRLYAGETKLAGLSLNGTRAAFDAVERCRHARADQARADVERERRRQQEAKRGGGDQPSTTAPPAKVEPAKPDKPEKPKTTSGTGFFVTDKGHIVTNHHVAGACSSIEVGYSGGLLQTATLLASDRRNDLALLTTGLKPKFVPALKHRVRVGDDVYVYGFPLSGLLGKTGNFTAGYVTSAAGLGDDTSQLQISAPIQPGNSGGPLVNTYGDVVGVIVSKLNVLQVAKYIKDLPQNVNFAIKSTVVIGFLEANGVELPGVEPIKKVAYEGGNGAPAKLSPADIAERSMKYTVRVICKND